jgi:septation ring formation regulator EzrA
VAAATLLALAAGCGGRVDSWQQEAGKMTEIAEARLQQLSARVDSLQESAQTASADVEKDVQERLRDLKEKERVARERLDQLRTAGEEHWRDFRSRLDEAMDALENSLADTTAGKPE